jgi:hypothetical protein
MNNLVWLQNWYIKQSYHEKIDISIKTNENRGWIIQINLGNTRYKDLPEFKQTNQKPDYDKYQIEFSKGFFSAEGNFTKLDFLIGMLREILGETEQYRKTQDYFWDKQIQEFLFESELEVLVFMHYTFKKSAADNILKSGFKFYDFDKTAMKANNLATELNYNHNIRKQFGEYVIVIQISRELYLHYLSQIDIHNKSNLKVEEILSEKPVYINDEGETVFTLHHKFIKGYFNYVTREIAKNPDFDPFFDSPGFKEHLK